MPNSFSRTPKLLKGALVELVSGLILPIPNVIVFQYNPSQMRRSLAVSNSRRRASESSSEEGPGTAVAGNPVETIEITLELDAADDLENPDSNPVAVISGVADRLAALEMLLYPSQMGLLDLVLPVRKTVPLVFFVWGPGRIVPVRVTQFSVEEQEFSPILYPIRASVNLGMTILQKSDFPQSDLTTKIIAEIANVAYMLYIKQKQVLATANTANSVESVLGMLPF